LDLSVCVSSARPSTKAPAPLTLRGGAGRGGAGPRARCPRCPWHSVSDSWSGLGTAARPPGLGLVWWHAREVDVGRPRPRFRRIHPGPRAAMLPIASSGPPGAGPRPPCARPAGRGTSFRLGRQREHRWRSSGGVGRARCRTDTLFETRRMPYRRARIRRGIALHPQQSQRHASGRRPPARQAGRGARGGAVT